MRTKRTNGRGALNCATTTTARRPKKYCTKYNVVAALKSGGRVTRVPPTYTPRDVDTLRHHDHSVLSVLRDVVVVAVNIVFVRFLSDRFRTDDIRCRDVFPTRCVLRTLRENVSPSFVRTRNVSAHLRTTTTRERGESRESLRATTKRYLRA